MQNILFKKFFIAGVLLAVTVFLPGNLEAAPLTGGFSFAPGVSDDPEEKANMFREARFRVITDAAKYLRVPYRSGGTSRAGFDCSGLVFRSFHDALGVSLPRTSDDLYSWSEKISLEEILPGDLVFFRTTSRGNISHVGIYTGEGNFIHSASQGPQTGVINSNLNESYYSRTFAGAGRAIPAANMEIRK